MSQSSTLAHEIQLASHLGGGQLNWCWTQSSAAALLELLFLGRISAIPETGWFARAEVRKIIVIDPTPTGQPILDLALARLVARGKPWEVHACIRRLATPISDAVLESLIAIRAIRRQGRPRGWKTTFWVAVPTAHDQAMRRINGAWANPLEVTDVRTGALVDLARNTYGMIDRGDREGTIRWEWYPAEIRDVVEQILLTVRSSTSGDGGSI